MSTGATEIGAIKARLELDTAGFKSGMDAAKKDLTAVSDNAKKASGSMDGLGASVTKAAESHEKIGKLTAVLDNVNARLEIQRKKLAELKASYDQTFNDADKSKLQAQIVSTEASILRLTNTSETAAKKIWELEDSLEDVGEEVVQTKRGFAGLESALVSVGASAALLGLVKTVRTLTDEAQALSMSMQGLSEVAKSLGHDVGDVTAAADKLSKRGFMTVQESAEALKTTLATGYGLEESINLINALSDAAAFNREAHFGWGEAIVQATRGIKMQNSNLTDSAGITTNLSVMYDRYAASIGTTAAKLTESGKAQAAYNGMMEEAALFTGNADKAMEGYAGTQAEFSQTIAMARAELGEAYLPIVEEITVKITDMIKQYSGWASANKETIAGTTAATAAILGLIAVLTTLVTVIGAVKIALDALKISMGPVGWLITALGVAAAGLGAYTVASNIAAESAAKLATNQEAVNSALENSPLNRTAAELTALRSGLDQVNELLAKQVELQTALHENTSSSMSGMSKFRNEARELRIELKEVNGQLAVFGINTPDDAVKVIGKLKAEIEASTPAMRELRMEELRGIAVKQDAIAESETLTERYRTLRDNTKRTADENAELTQVIRQLTTRYPELHAEMDAQGQLLITNEGLIRDLITAEQDSVDKMLTAEAAKRKSLIRTTEAAIKSAEAQIAALEAVAAAEPKPAEWAEGIPGLDMLSKSIHGQMGGVVEKAKANYRDLNGLMSEYKTELAAIENGTWPGLLDTNKKQTPLLVKEDKDKEKGTKAKTADQLAQEAYRAALQLMEKRRLLGDLTEKQEIDKLEALAKQYAKYDDIWIDAESRRQRVVAQMAADAAKSAEDRARQSEAEQRKGYEKSAEWIEMETRRMTEKGATEREITQMTLEAWTRVRNRYESDTDYYKRADKAMYDARMTLRKDDERAAKEAAAVAEKSTKELTKSVLDAIDKQRKAELDALDERKRATAKYYDDLLRMADEAERGRDRKAIQEEAEKYRLATSEKGQKRYAELQEQLRKMDVEDGKRALQDERDTKLKAFDEQKRDIDAWYSDLKSAADSFNGDMIRMYELTEDARFAAFVTTNTAIKAEMQRFQAEMARINSAAAPTMSVVDPFKTSVTAQMQANATAWNMTSSADEKARLSADSKRLGASIGASYNSGKGMWAGADGLPLFHTGRNGATGGTFSAGDRLMPDELTAILREDEYVFTPGQLRSLLDGVGGRGGNTYVEKIVGVEMHDTVLEDEIDMRAVGRTGTDMAAEMARNNFTGGGR